MTERRALLAATISSIFIIWYSQTVLKRFPKPEQSQQRSQQQTTTNRIETNKKSLPPAFVEEDSVSIESNDLRVEIGARTGAIQAVTLNGFKDETKKRQLYIKGELPIFEVIVGGKPLLWRVANNSMDKITFNSTDSNGNSYMLVYLLNARNPLIKVHVKRHVIDSTAPGPAVSFYNSWTKADSLDSRSNRLEAVVSFLSDGNRQSYKHYYQATNGERTVPRGTRLFSLAERHFCQSVLLEDGIASIKVIPSGQKAIVLETVNPLVKNGDDELADETIYIGPRDYFYLKKAEFELAFPIGVLGKIGLALLLVLTWVASLTKNYGVAIIIFSGIVTCATAPFTLLSFKSMKRMQELKPDVDKIMAKHKDDPKKANREVLGLYKTHKVSPLGGCLPMLLQMPIFLALFQAISHFVELRGKSFLWITDLSLPDRVARLPVPVPLLGSDLNILPIIMAAAMYLQTKVSQQSMATGGTTSSVNVMSGPLMSVMFGLMFYHFPSGLVLYWLTNSLMAMLWYKLAS